MKPKSNSKYKNFILLSSCIIALSCSYYYINKTHTSIINSSKIHSSIVKQPIATSNEDNNSQKNHNRIIIVPSERTSTPDQNMTDTTGEIRVPISEAGDALKVKPLPPADNNATIIVNLLTSD